MTYTVVVIAAFVIVPYFSKKLLNLRDKNAIRKSIAFDRIARLADIGEKDIHFYIRSSYSYTNIGYKGRMYSVQFIYTCDASLLRSNNKNPNHYAGDAHQVDTYHSNASVEENVAKSILQIKFLYSQQNATAH